MYWRKSRPTHSNTRNRYHHCHSCHNPIRIIIDSLHSTFPLAGLLMTSSLSIPWIGTLASLPEILKMLVTPTQYFRKFYRPLSCAIQVLEVEHDVRAIR